jgi:uncharacterized protein (DUF4415 family)
MSVVRTGNVSSGRRALSAPTEDDIAAEQALGTLWAGQLPPLCPEDDQAAAISPQLRRSGLFLLWYARGMSSAKRKVSVSLDEDLVAELEREDQGLSVQVNQALREELERRRRHRLLGELLDQLDAKEGPVEESLIAKYVEILR